MITPYLPVYSVQVTIVFKAMGTACIYIGHVIANRSLIIYFTCINNYGYLYDAIKRGRKVTVVSLTIKIDMTPRQDT